MKYAPIITLALAAAFVAGCGGGSSITQEEHDAVQQQAKNAAEEAEKQKERAEAAEAARQKAAREKQQAEQALRDEQQRQQELAEQARQAEEERDAAQQKLNRFVALEIVNAIPTHLTGSSLPPAKTVMPDTPSVRTLSYGQPVLATATGATFTSTITGSSRGWFKTTRSGSSQQRRDFVEIFSNAEAPTREDFEDHALGLNLDYDANGRVLGLNNHIDISTPDHGTIAASPRFPLPSTKRQGELETFTVTDRGPSQDEKDTATTAYENQRDDGDPTTNYDTSDPDYRLPVRNMDRYPERYSVDISGTLQGAPGTFRCAGTASDGSCTVDISGPNNYVFANGTGVEWQFIPTSATSKVIIPDGEYMWFGWWMREPIETTPNAADAVFDYAADYGGMGAVTSFSGATGSATYEGTAIGYYGFYDIEAAEDDRSRAGWFQAKATLTADFANEAAEGTISGSITEFDTEFGTEPTWSVTLKSQTISSGTVEAANNAVSWSIRGLPRDGGQWEAKFYSNFESPAATAQPTGVAGSFTAQYGDHRRMIGAFGAERD